jgi:hypothetical protein
MNGFLAIAEAFLERMTNPLYGNEMNDQYSLRFNQLLAEDREFADSFANLSLDPEDVGTLPVCAWPWYLQWRLERAAPPSPDFLDALFESTEDPAVRMAVTQSALSDIPEDVPDHADMTGDAGEEPTRPVALEADATRELFPGRRRRPEIRSRWLRTRVNRLAGDRDPARAVAEAEDLAIYLLQLGDPDSLAVLQSLVEERQGLGEVLGQYLAEAGLDSGDADRWRSEHGL